MTFAGRCMALFPACHLLLICAGTVYFAKDTSVWSFLLIPSAIYLFPLASFRLHNFIAPLRHGRSNIGLPVYCPWWGGFQCQALFCAVPWLEAVLRIIPGAYSAWLRLWGSKIGKNVFWTPIIEITDRSVLEIGSGCILGHETKCIGHYIRRNHLDELELYIQKIRIGSNCFIGAGSRIGPGTFIGEGSKLKVLTDVYPDVVLPPGYKSRGRQTIKVGDVPCQSSP